MTFAAAVIVGVLALLALQAAVNHRCVRRLHALPQASGISVAVLLPARNEAGRIAATVQAWLAQAYLPFTLTVYDDDSSDATAAVARAAGGDDPRLRVIPGGALPTGWKGKPHACHRLRVAADAEVLIFADVDVTPDRHVVARAVGGLLDTGAAAMSALPRPHDARVAMRALIGLQRWAALTLVPWWFARWGRAPALAVMNGQFIAIWAHVYDAVGGFAAVADSLAEDVALGRRLAACGHRAIFVDGAVLLRCRPYATYGEAWAANVRNLAAAALGSSVLAVGGAAALLLLHAVPVIALVAGRVSVPGWPWMPLLAVALALLPRRLADRGTGSGVGATALHPLAVTLLALMLLESWWRARRGRSVQWRGRRYRATDSAG